MSDCASRRAQPEVKKLKSNLDFIISGMCTVEVTNPYYLSFVFVKY